MVLSEYNNLLNIDCPTLDQHGEDPENCTLSKTREEKLTFSKKGSMVFSKLRNALTKVEINMEEGLPINRIKNFHSEMHGLTCNDIRVHDYFNWSQTNTVLAIKLQRLLYKSLGLIINEETMAISNIKKLIFFRKEIPWFLIGQNENFRLTFQDFEPFLKNGVEGYLESNAVSYIMSYLTKSTRLRKNVVIHCTLASELLGSHFEGISEEKLKLRLLDLPTDIEVIFLPLLSRGRHFQLLICDLKESRLCLLDSLLSKAYTQSFSSRNYPIKKFEYLTSSQERYTNLKHVRINAIPQNDGYNCGLYVIKYARDYLASRFPLGQYFETEKNSRVQCNTYRMHLAAYVLRTELTKNDRTEECSLCFKEKSKMKKCKTCQRMFCEECEVDLKDSNESKCRLCDPNV